MFKKIINIVTASTIIAIVPIIVFYTHAAQFSAETSVKFEQSAINKAFPKLTIIAGASSEITKENDLSLILPDGMAIQWNTESNSSIKLSGTATTKVKSEPTFSEDLYTLTFDVTEDFATDDTLYIEGLMPRTFKKEITSRTIGLDVNGDKMIDVVNVYSFLVKDYAKTDFAAPYKPKEFKVTYNKTAKQVEFSWKNPPDWDFLWTAVKRERWVDGQKEVTEIYKGTATAYSDSNVSEDEAITYSIYASDKSNNVTSPVEVAIKVGVPAVEPEEEEEPVVEPEDPKPEEEEGPEQDEKTAELKKQLNYYYLRYQIKCEIAGTNPNSSNCLFSKIDLLYTQNILKEVKAKISLSERELSLLKSRIKWPELTYKKKCTDATTPDKFCPSLKEGIERTKYFIN